LAAFVLAAVTEFSIRFARIHLDAFVFDSTANSFDPQLMVLLGQFDNYSAVNAVTVARWI